MIKTCHYCGADVSLNYYCVEKDGERFRICNRCNRKHKGEVKFIFRHTSALKAPHEPA